jgi:hypothetical protein
MNTPTEAEIAFCAGLFEGEGCISRSSNSCNSFAIAIKMTDREPLERFRDIMGAGEITYSPVRHEGHKPQFTYRIANWSEIIKTIEMIRKWLCPRRIRQIEKALESRPKFPRGEPACPETPFASVMGYQRHKYQGTTPCEICLESRRLYMNAWRADRLGRPIRRYTRRQDRGSIIN